MHVEESQLLGKIRYWICPTPTWHKTSVLWIVHGLARHRVSNDHPLMLHGSPGGECCVGTKPVIKTSLHSNNFGCRVQAHGHVAPLTLARSDAE